MTIQIRIIIIITITNKEYKAKQKSICVRMRKGENGEETKLLKDICIEFPPDVKKISLFIRENMDVELMNWKKKEEIVSEIIQHEVLKSAFEATCKRRNSEAM